MTKRFSILLATGLLSLSIVHAETEAALGNDINSLIIQLSDSDFAVREAASKRIWEYGVEAVPYLEKAAASKDPETASRASVLIRNIAAGILPSTPPEIADLIEKYSKNNINGKQAILRELTEKTAYKQVLHMLSWEKNPQHRELLMREFRNVGLLAARQAISSGDLDEAANLLKIAPRNEANLRALAFLLKRSGKIDAEIERMSQFKPNEDLDEWMKILLQIKGDRKALKKFAQSRDNKGILATLAVFEGDPVPAMDLIAPELKTKYQKAGLDYLRTTAITKKGSAQIQKTADKLAAELTSWSKLAESEPEMEAALRTMFITGNSTAAEALYGKYDQEQYFLFLDSYERPDEALKALGVPSAKDDPDAFLEWVKKSIKSSIDEDEDQHGGHQNRILNVANFYFSRGEKEIARTVLKEMLMVYEKEGLDRWYEVVSQLPHSGMSEMAIEFALERGNKDNDLERLINTFYGDTLDIDRIWKTLRSRDKTIEDDFVDMAILMGMYKNKLDRGHELEAEVLADAKQRGRTSYIDMLFSLAEAASIRNDMASSLSYYRSIAKLGKEAEGRREWKSQYRAVAEGLLSWKDYIDAYEAQKENLQELPVELSKYAIALKKVGRNKEGDLLLDQALTMTLSIPTEYNEIGLLLYEVGYEDEAMQIWADTLVGYFPNDWEFHYSLQYMGYLSKYYIHKKDWKTASTLATIEAALGLKQSTREFNAPYSLRSGFYAYFTNGMLDIQQGRDDAAIWKLRKAHDMALGDGLLADEFYPSLRATNLSSEYDQWFMANHEKLEKVTKKYPNAHNTHNTIAWLGSRAVRELESTLQHAQKAVELMPQQGAYLDTLAETHFAMQDRDKAIKWSNKAIKSTIDGSMGYDRTERQVYQSHIDLTSQLERFKTEPFPSPEVKKQ